MQADMVLSGTFIAQPNYPDNGYTVHLTGAIYHDYGDGDANSEEISLDMNIFKNQERCCWDIFHTWISNLAAYYQGQNPEEDTDFSTPVYIFPPLDSMPNYPFGMIQVEHHLLYGVSNEVLDNDLSSILTITFTVI